MISYLLFSLWFFLPAGVANMIPIFAAKLPLLKNYSFPLDAYKKIGNKRILGNHKTIRGMVSGVVIGICVVYIQQYMYTRLSILHSFVLINYSLIHPYILGGLLGFGALFGDACKSFVKRQFVITEGKSWLFFDQIDYVIGGIVFSGIYIHLPFLVWGYIIVIWFCLHLLVSFIGFLLGLKDSPI